MKIFVTGMGVVSPIGLTVEENLRSLKSGITGITKSPKHNLMIGEVRLTNEQIIHQLNLPVEDYSRTTLLGMLAALTSGEVALGIFGIIAGPLMLWAAIKGFDNVKKNKAKSKP